MRVLESFAEGKSVEDTDIWSAVYGPILFVIGFRFLFYLALVYKHSGNRK